MIPERLPAHTRNPRKLVNAVRASSRDSGDKTRTQFECAPENYTLTRVSLRAITRAYKQIDFCGNRINRERAVFLRKRSVQLGAICDLQECFRRNSISGNAGELPRGSEEDKVASVPYSSSTLRTICDENRLNSFREKRRVLLKRNLHITHL